MPEGTTRISVELQQFEADSYGYFQAPANLAPKILEVPGFRWVGSERPSQLAGSPTSGDETRALRRLLDMFKADPDRRISKAGFRAALEKQGPALGPRAFDRVWQKAVEQVPERQRPGRKSNRNTS